MLNPVLLALIELITVLFVIIATGVECRGTILPSVRNMSCVYRVIIDVASKK